MTHATTEIWTTLIHNREMTTALVVVTVTSLTPVILGVLWLHRGRK